MDVRSDVVKASSSQVVTQQRERAVDAVLFQVLDNPSLREEILKHVIFTKDSLDRKAACTLRQVHPNWNESVLRILAKAHEPLFKLDDRTRKAADNFLATFSASAEVMGSVPPLAIRHFGDLGEPKNLEIFLNCLTRCGSGVIQVGLTISEKGRPIQNTPLPTNLSLPRLHKLNIVLDMVDLADRESDEQGEVTVDDGDKLSTCMIKSVLSSATVLKEMRLVITPPKRSQFALFDSVILPPSISKMQIVILYGTTQLLEILARNPLPNLVFLSIVYLESGIISVGLLYRILDNFRKSLKSFNLYAQNEQEDSARVTRLPVMEQLVGLSMHGAYIEPELGGRGSLEKYFPKLRIFSPPTESINMFQKWVGSSPLPGVIILRLSLSDDSKFNLNMNNMQRVNFIFPNLRKLWVTVSSEESSGLEYIFREMRQLTELDINVKCKLEQNTSSDTWDSLLTGVPVEVIARSRVDPQFWEKNELEDENFASIRNLAGLKKCSLKFDPVHAGANGDARPAIHPSISDFVFKCALLRMPKLKGLHLQRASAYNVSQEMITKWRNEGRSLTLQP